MSAKRTNGANQETPLHHSGFIGIVGRPNVGKSTLLNQLLGERIAIVSPKPQTTRNRITGIRTTPTSQIVFLDTPGMHQPHSLMNRRMVEIAQNTLREVDGVLWLVDAAEGIQRGDEEIARTLRESHATGLLLLNKLDLISRGKLLPLMEQCSGLLPGREIIPISARSGEGLPLLLDLIEKWLPEGPRYYPKGEVTNQTERFVASEMIREKIFLLTRGEIPYATAVTIDEFKERAAKPLVVIKATIHADRESHKPILIGKGGKMLREIGTQARQDLEDLLGCKIFLGLFIKVQKGWTQNPRALTELGL
ncbi:MAG: GTPase Era [Candidatus Binatia bacterium]